MAQKVEASWSGLLGIITGKAEATETLPPDGNSQTVGLVSQVVSELASQNLASVALSGDALLPDSGPVGTMADVEDWPENGGRISLYAVRAGDTLSEIAEMYSVSVNTIAWANDISAKAALKEGQLLVILPVSGIRHTVAKGETIQSIAKKYKGDAEEIVLFNGLEGAKLAIGQVVIIPNGQIAPTSSSGSSGKPPVPGSGGPSYAGYYLRPIKGIRTQGLHAYNAIDIGAPVGTSVVAAAEGQVVISRGGWNGGFGNYLVIEHPNKTQTLYAHLSSNLVVTGQSVTQGQLIGLSGSTGKSTGPHLHFEVRGAKNPF